MTRYILFLFVILSFGFYSALHTTTVHASQTLAEKLGFNRNDRLLILHADDLGMCHSVNQASFEAMESGAVSSASVIVNSPWASEVAEKLKKNPNLDIGVHLNFTSEWKNYRVRPVSPPDWVRTLVDYTGFLWSSPEEVLVAATAPDVEKEIESQILRALKMGFKPSHLDTHSAVMFLKPEFLNAYVNMAKKYNLVPILPRITTDSETFMKAIGLPLDEIRPLLQDYDGEGLATISTIVMDTETKTREQRVNKYQELFKKLKPGLTLVLLDLSYETEELKALTSSMFPGNASLDQMFTDRAFFSHSKTKAYIEKLGIRLISWRDVANVMWPSAQKY